MISVYDIDGVTAFCRKNGIRDHDVKRFFIAFLKKGRALEDCLQVLPEPGRSTVRSHVTFHELALAEKHDSRIDGATKLVFKTHDGLRLESVILRITSGRTSLCISSQVGCAAACAFCATGRMGLMRNLTTHEILDQVILARRLLGDESRTLRNVVFMGMGEPFHNEKAVHEALEVLRDPKGCHFAERHLLVSTVGMVVAMERFVERFPGIRLALSLHSARQDVRRELMPSAKSQSLERLREIFPTVGRHGNFMVEYLLLKGVNDGPEDLAALVDLLRGVNVHINLIQFNPHPGADFEPVPKAARETFGAALRKEGFKVTLRYSLGNDIAAACGQLAGKS